MKLKIKTYIFIIVLIVCSIALYENIPYLRIYLHTQQIGGQVIICFLLAFAILVCIININERISND